MHSIQILLSRQHLLAYAMLCACIFSIASSIAWKEQLGSLTHVVVFLQSFQVKAFVAPQTNCIFIANDHGQVLSHWLEGFAAVGAPASPLAVVHIDAHNDLNVPEEAAVFGDEYGGDWWTNLTRRNAIARSADLANYQLHAVWAGMVDSITWLRQGYGETESSQSALILNTSTRTFLTDIVTGDVLDAHKFFDYLEVFADRLLEKQTLEMVHSRTWRRPWILDIDLDFFVDSKDRPKRPPWARSGLGCQPCRDWWNPECPIWSELEDILLSGRLNHTCSAILSAWSNLSDSERMWIQDLEGIHIPEKLLILDILAKGSPLEMQEPGLVCKLVDRVAKLLESLHNHPPMLITIARSIDGFASIFHTPALERFVLGLLRRIWPAFEGCTQYAPGTATLEALSRIEQLQQCAPSCIDDASIVRDAATPFGSSATCVSS